MKPTHSTAFIKEHPKEIMDTAKKEIDEQVTTTIIFSVSTNLTSSISLCLIVEQNYARVEYL